MNRIALDNPPVVELIANEQLWGFSTPAELERYLRSRGLVAELRRQARWTRDSYDYPDASGTTLGTPRTLVVTPSGSLNPFSPAAKCNSPSCRLKCTYDFVQSVALYSDLTYLPDPFTDLLCDPSRLSGYKLENLFVSIQQLRLIYPLLKHGVLRFATPFRGYCPLCAPGIGETLVEAANSLAVAAEPEIHARYHVFDEGPGIYVASPVLYPDSTHTLGQTFRLTPKQHAEYVAACGDKPLSRCTLKSRRFLSSLMRESILRDVHRVFHELVISEGTHSLLLAGSRLEPLILSQISHATLEQLQRWESLRTVELPWLHELTAEEIIRLREEADRALPRLRDLILTRVTIPTATPCNFSEVIAELRDQAAEVEDELEALQLVRQRRFSAGIGALSMLMVVYGFASGVPQVVGTAGAALIAVLAHLRNTEREQDATLSKLEARPAYALLKAKQLVESRSRRADAEPL